MAQIWLRGFIASRHCISNPEHLPLTPAVLLILAQYVKTAMQAQTIMAAYHFAAFRAAPFLFFLFQKHLHTLLFDVIQVFEHAHMVFGAVTLIKGFEAFAGEIFALRTEADQSFPQQMALLLHMGTVLTPRQAAGTIFPLKALFLQIIFHCLIADA